MRRSLLAVGLTVGAMTLGACSTLGQPTTFDLAELTQRCEQRGGTLAATGRQTGRAQADYICLDDNMARAPQRGAARAQLSQAVDQSLRRGY